MSCSRGLLGQPSNKELLLARVTSRSTAFALQLTLWAGMLAVQQNSKPLEGAGQRRSKADPRQGLGGMNRESLTWWLTLLANLGVLGGLVFVGLELRQNTSQLRTEGAHSVTEIVNSLNAGVYSDPSLADLIIRGSADLSSLDPVERERFDRFQFSRLNIAEYMLDLEREGVADLNFSYSEAVIRDFNTRPGLRAFIREYQAGYVGSEELLELLLGGG